MTPITTIVRFRVPPANVDRLLAFWQQDVRDRVQHQPGLIDGVLHRSLDRDEPEQLVNVARWHSAVHLATALETAEESLRDRGIDRAGLFSDLEVTTSQGNYEEAVRYTGLG